MSKVLSTVRRRDRVGTDNQDPSKTEQSELHRADIRHILGRYKEVGIVDVVKAVGLDFRDLTQYAGTADMLQDLKRVELEYNQLPSKVREAFGDLEGFLEVADDPAKLEELRPKLAKLGLMDELSPAAKAAAAAEAASQAATEASPTGEATA